MKAAAGCSLERLLPRTKRVDSHIDMDHLQTSHRSFALGRVLRVAVLHLLHTTVPNLQMSKIAVSAKPCCLQP